MRFNNKTNIPNKAIMNVVNHIDKYSPMYSFADKYGNNSQVYRISIEGFPDLMVNRNDKFCDVTTVGNAEYYNVDKDGKPIKTKVENDEDIKKKKKK